MKTKTKLIIGAMIALTLIVVGFILGRKKDKKGSGSPTQTIVHADGQPVQFTPAELASELFDVMDGIFDYTNDKRRAWQKLASLPEDWQVMQVYSYFNENYGDGQTLTQWIHGEYTGLTDTSKQDALTRLGHLGLN